MEKFNPKNFDDVNPTLQIINDMHENQHLSNFEYMLLATQLKIVQTLSEIREAVNNLSYH
jgi:hypothetical protein